MEDKIYVIGHKNPEPDSICSAIVLAGLKGYVPARAGEVNPDTLFILNRFNAVLPEKIENAEAKKLFLVDHNEISQMVDGGDKAELIGIIDHHKINLSYGLPIFIHTEPLGATATVVAKLFWDEIIKNKSYCGLLLSAILTDTVVFRSVTTTEEDREMAKKLAEIAGIADMEEFGIEIKKQNATLKGKDIAVIAGSDMKIFDFNGKKIAIGQVEIVDPDEIEERRLELLDCLRKTKEENNYELAAFMATDIIKEATELLFAGDPAIIEKAFAKKPENNSVYLEGVMSRKKQIVPELERAFTN